jgi:hypothetical protein
MCYTVQVGAEEMVREECTHTHTHAHTHTHTHTKRAHILLNFHINAYAWILSQSLLKPRTWMML